MLPRFVLFFAIGLAVAGGAYLWFGEAEPGMGGLELPSSDSSVEKAPLGINHSREEPERLAAPKLELGPAVPTLRPESNSKPADEASVVQSISGRVVDESGEGIPDLPIRARIFAGASYQTTTDSMGQFCIQVREPGDYLVTIESEPLFGPDLVRATVGPSQQIELDPIELIPGGNLQVEVIFRAGIPQTYEILYGQAEGRSPARSEYNIESGTGFELSNLEPGLYEILGLTENCGQARGQARIRPGQTVELLLKFEPVTILSGQALNPDGSPLADEAVSLLPDWVKSIEWLTTLEQMTLTDADGAFAFEDLSPGQYKLALTVPGAFPVEKEVRVTQGRQATIEIRLPKSSLERLTGVVVDPEGMPLPKANLKLFPVGEGIQSGQSTTADASGRFVFQSPPVGKLKIYADRPPTGDGVRSWRGEMEVTFVAGEAKNIRVVCQRYRRLR